jgi:hypothetical protein
MLLALAAGLVNQGGVCKDSVFATEYAKAFDINRGYGGSAEKVRKNSETMDLTPLRLPVR